MILTYAAKLGFQIRLTDFGAQKIDGSTLKIFEMVLTSFQIKDKFKMTRFFQKTFLLPNTSMAVILNRLFFNFEQRKCFVGRAKTYLKIIYIGYSTMNNQKNVINWLKKICSSSIRPKQKSIYCTYYLSKNYNINSSRL